MLNHLQDVSIKTMIGLLPDIINFNNESIRKEFDNIFDSNYNRLIKSIYAPLGSVKAHNGEFVNLQVDYLTVNHLDSLIYSLSAINHNSFTNRFSIDLENNNLLNADNKAKYVHDAKSIIYDIQDGSIITLYDVIKEIQLSLNTAEQQAIYSQANDTTPGVYSLNNQNVIEPYSLPSKVLSGTKQYINRQDLPKWLKFDAIAGMVYLYYEVTNNNVIISDKRPASLSGNVGDIVNIDFEDTGNNDYYKILLSRKDNKYVILSKDDMNILKLKCINNSEEYGSVWKIESYSVRNSDNIKLA